MNGKGTKRGRCEKEGETEECREERACAWAGRDEVSVNLARGGERGSGRETRLWSKSPFPIIKKRVCEREREKRSFGEPIWTSR